jgi:polyphosphate kinase 2 (PPK2 family)
MKALEKDPDTRWRVSKAHRALAERYDEVRTAAETMIRETSTGEAPWIVIDGYDHRYRTLTVGRILLEAMRRRLDQTAAAALVTAAPVVPQVDNVRLVRNLDLSQRLEKDDYRKQLEKHQQRFGRMVRSGKFRKHSLLLAFEGSDAAGKGGTIRRVTGALDAREYRIVPVAAPTEEERAQPYLWRFWRHAPGKGGITIFDRTWYGRVLVERVEGYCSDADWMRAYDEIHEFEEQLVDNGTIVLAADQQGRAAAPVPGARADRLQALQDHRGGLAQPRQVGGLRAGRGGHGRSHVDQPRALDAGRGQRQVLCAGEGARDHLRRGGARDVVVRGSWVRCVGQALARGLSVWHACRPEGRPTVPTHEAGRGCGSGFSPTRMSA